MDDNPQGRVSTSHGHLAEGPFQYPDEQAEFSAAAAVAMMIPTALTHVEVADQPIFDQYDDDDEDQPLLDHYDDAADLDPPRHDADAFDHSDDAADLDQPRYNAAADADEPLVDPYTDAPATLCILATEDLLPSNWDSESANLPEPDEIRQPLVANESADLIASVTPTPQ